MEAMAPTHPPSLSLQTDGVKNTLNRVVSADFDIPRCTTHVHNYTRDLHIVVYIIIMYAG